jgi:hypothetical protein
LIKQQKIENNLRDIPEHTIILAKMLQSRRAVFE